MIEFLPWYEAGVALSQCGGPSGCGAVVANKEQHLKWHESIVRHGTPYPGDKVLGK